MRVLSLPTSTTTDEVWCLLIDHEKKPKGVPEPFGISPQTTIGHLKGLVWRSNRFSLEDARVDANKLVVLGCLDGLAFVNASDDAWLHELTTMNFSAVKQLDGRKKVMESVVAGERETLLVQMPGAFPVIPLFEAYP